MKRKPQLNFARDQLICLCQKHGIRKLGFFGSVMRDDFGPESDVDIMIEFEENFHPGWNIVHVLDDFSQLFGGRDVDHMTFKQFDKSLSRLAHYVNKDLEIYYEKDKAS